MLQTFLLRTTVGLATTMARRKTVLARMSRAGRAPGLPNRIRVNRFRPGTVALREIRKYQATVHKLIPRASFDRLCRSIVEKQQGVAARYR